MIMARSLCALTVIYRRSVSTGTDPLHNRELCITTRRRHRVPMIGLVQVGTQAMADRYTYIPLIGPFIIIVWCFSYALEHYENGSVADEAESLKNFAQESIYFLSTL